MFSEERKEGSPRFRKLHFPVGLWINSPKKHFAKLSKKWPSVGSVKSTSSDTASRTSETVEMRQPTKNKNNRHKRLSNIFQRGSSGIRWGSEKKLYEIEDVKLDMDTMAELTGQKNVPGILKIFGEGISAGANYKSVLATPRSTSQELVKEALERYSVDVTDVQDFVLCDVIGSFEGVDGDWKMEYLRIVGDYEKPLVLQDMWKPKTGFSRRFEIRKKTEVEKLTIDDDKETAGINAQARKLQKSRSRAASGGSTPLPREGSDGTSLRRSISELNLNARRRKDRKNVKSMMVADAHSIESGNTELENETPATNAREENDLGGDGGTGDVGGGGADEDCMDPDKLDRLSQSLILPPTDLPYFLLLQGYNPKEDFVVYVMTGKKHIFGKGGKTASGQKERIDTYLTAPDILSRHCVIRQVRLPGKQYQMVVRPFRGACVTHNGGILLREAVLLPGDLVGMGEHFLFMYKDPRVAQDRLAWLPKPSTPQTLSGVFCCQMCGRSLQERQEAFRAYMESKELLLQYWPENEDSLLKEILTTADGEFKLAPAYLFSLCIQHSTSFFEPQHFPKLLLKIANIIKKVVWDKIKEIGDSQPENQQVKACGGTLSVEQVVTDLRPLMLWMSNSVELLNFFQKKVLEMEKDWETEGIGDDPLIVNDLETCEEAMTLLDEVIMYTFQQCVYYLTKTLYTALPSLLDTNPFTTSGDLANVEDLSSMPEGVRGTLDIYQATFHLSHECELHPDLLSQTFGYLFFFSNTSLFNTLMERGNGDSFYQWSKAVQIRTNLDLILDWLQRVGLGDIAAEFFRKLSSTVNLLCIPKTSLLKASWANLRLDYPALSPAQLNHLLRNYQLGLGRQHPETWDPPPEERVDIANVDIFESFTDHPPLILPNDNFHLKLSEPVSNEVFLSQLQQIRRFVWNLEQQSLSTSQKACLDSESSS
ncbi:ras-interacting protein 1 [Protopterus annectens]|uniref:ras-interacting protein 1 n=1 Tax=Protopterus annectens TaxID=7888 RepID=UPI001CFC3E4D|nr:ras-interacting protein 1 [Protopterus annectens]